MATAERAPCQCTQNVRLTLSQDEAGALAKVLASVGGSLLGYRALTDAVADVLEMAGVTPLGLTTGSVYFKP